MNRSASQIASLLSRAIAQLADNGVLSPRLDAEVLLAYALGCERSQLMMMNDDNLTDDILNKFDTLIYKRAKHCPVAYLTGVKEFWSIPIKVTKDVLIPRPETELIVETVVKLAKGKNAELEILDLCTGSGCVAAAIAHELVNAHITATDISKAAINVARENTSSFGGRVNTITSDLFANVPDTIKFDFITANPPYIAICEEQGLANDILEYEPHLALFGGELGLDFIQRIIKDAGGFLKPGGVLIMEIGINQANAVRELANTNGYGGIEILKDLAGTQRVAKISEQ